MIGVCRVERNKTGQVESGIKSVQRPTVSRTFGRPEQTTDRTFIVKPEMYRTGGSPEGCRRTLPHGMVQALTAEIPCSGRFPAGQAQSGKKSGKNGKSGNAGVDPGQLVWGPVKYS